MKPQPRKARIRASHLISALQVASYIAGVLAIVLVVIQMRTDAATRRAERSLDFLRQFNSEPLSSHRLNAMRPWTAVERELGLVNRRGGLPREEIDALARSLVSEFDARHPDSPASPSIREVVSFYDQLKICAEERVCDERILRTYFRQFAVNFRCTSAAVISDLKQTASSSFGTGLEWFAGGASCQ